MPAILISFMSIGCRWNVVEVSQWMSRRKRRYFTWVRKMVVNSPFILLNHCDSCDTPTTFQRHPSDIQAISSWIIWKRKSDEKGMRKYKIVSMHCERGEESHKFKMRKLWFKSRNQRFDLLGFFYKIIRSQFWFFMWIVGKILTGKWIVWPVCAAILFELIKVRSKNAKIGWKQRTRRLYFTSNPERCPKNMLPWRRRLRNTTKLWAPTQLFHRRGARHQILFVW